MKALVFENNQGIKNSIPFKNERIALKKFNKVCYFNCRFICTSQKRFDKIVSKNKPYSNGSIFLGVGIYDCNGNFYTELTDEDGKYYIEDYTERAFISDIIRRAKINFGSLFLS